MARIFFVLITITMFVGCGKSDTEKESLENKTAEPVELEASISNLPPAIKEEPEVEESEGQESEGQESEEQESEGQDKDPEVPLTSEISSGGDSCNLSIDAADNMQFSTKSMSAPASCATVVVTLNHTGQFPKNAMGHNWVLTTEADFKGVAMDGGSAGLKNNYLKEGDTRVIAATSIIGGGESTSVTFSTDGLAEGIGYTFFCSFPGHWGIMKGTFTLN